MASVDLLSATSGEQGDARSPTNFLELEQITEEANTMTISAAAPSLLPTVASTDANQQKGPSTIYQVDFDVEHIGKKKPSSKRVASWKYGIPRESAAGSMTVAGHEAKLTWSTHSGKYTISVDGEEVFSSVAKGSVLEHKWKWSHTRGCVVEDGDDAETVAMRIIACRKPPTRSSKDFRCYEFIIGGKVFRNLPSEGSDGFSGGYFENEERAYEEGKLMTILDVIEPGWRASGFA